MLFNNKWSLHVTEGDIRMDLELVKFINSDLTWNAVKKGHRSMMRRPRKTESSGSEFGFHSGNKMQESVVFDYEKSGVAILGQHFAEEVLDIPIKKRILLLQSPGQGARSNQPQTKESELPKGSKHASGAIKSNQIEKEIPDLNDFSGIELLAAAACHSSVEEHTTPRVDSYPDGSEDGIAPVNSDDSSVQDNTFPVTQNVCDNGNDEGNKTHIPSKGVRLHWDLNTVMDEWEEPCDILVDPHSEIFFIKDVYNDGLQNETRKSQDVCDIQGNNDGDHLGKTNDSESCVSKSDVIDSFTQPTKCEHVSTSTASVSLEQTTLKVESEVVQGGCLSIKGETDDKLTSEDRLSDCCGSNVSQDKVKSGYNSPVEDGELREPARHQWQKEEFEEKECVDYESDNMYEDNFDTTESVTDEIEQGDKALGEVPKNEIEQVDKTHDLGSMHSQSVILEEKDSRSKKLIPERKSMLSVDKSTSTSFGVSKNATSICRSRSDNIRDSYSQAERDFSQEKSMGRDRSVNGQRVDSFSRNNHGYPRLKNIRSGGSSSIDNNQAINYNNPRGIYRNESYGIHRGTPPSRDISRDRCSRVGLRGSHQEEYDEPGPCYSDRKVPFFFSNYNRGANISRSRKRSRSRSRSGSPIAWHFQKKRNVDTKRQSPDYKSDSRLTFPKPNEIEDARVSAQIVSRGCDEYRDRRSSLVRTFDRAHHRLDPPGYLGKLKSNDHFRPRFPPNREKFETNYSSIHDDKYGMMNERRRFRYDDDNESFKGYSRNKDDGFRYTRNENKYFRDPENTSEEKGCRYATNKMFNTHKDN